jgi:hypothetical protein
MNEIFRLAKTFAALRETSSLLHRQPNKFLFAHTKCTKKAPTNRLSHSRDLNANKQIAFGLKAILFIYATINFYFQFFFFLCFCLMMIIIGGYFFMQQYFFWPNESISCCCLIAQNSGLAGFLVACFVLLKTRQQKTKTRFRLI